MANRIRNKEPLGKRLKLSAMCYLMMAPFMVFFITLTVVPVISTIILSFTDFNMLQSPTFSWLTNYERMLLDDQIFPKVMRNTLFFGFVTGPASYLISFFCAWLISEFRPRMRSLFTLMFYMPALSGNLYIIWTYIFSGDQYGFINSFAMTLGLLEEPVQWLSDPKTMLGAVIVVQLWTSLNIGFLAFIAGFQNMDRSLFEAGAIDGIKNRWQELWYITIPSMAPQLLFSAVMQISLSFGAGQIVQAMAGFPTTQYAADTIITYMLDVGTVRFEMGYASALAVFLFALMLLTNYIITHLLKNYDN